MAYPYIIIVCIVFTLVQCSQSEIINSGADSWYSANVIKDGNFSPKPISELFSTDINTFSTKNPIVVLAPATSSTPLLSSSGITTLSTPSPSTSNQSGTSFASTVPVKSQTSVIPIESQTSVAPIQTPPINSAQPQPPPAPIESQTSVIPMQPKIQQLPSTPETIQYQSPGLPYKYQNLPPPTQNYIPLQSQFPFVNTRYQPTFINTLSPLPNDQSQFSPSLIPNQQFQFPTGPVRYQEPIRYQTPIGITEIQTPVAYVPPVAAAAPAPITTTTALPTLPPSSQGTPTVQYVVCPSCISNTPSPTPVTTLRPAMIISNAVRRPPCNVTQRTIVTRPGQPYIRIRMFSSNGEAPVINLGGLKPVRRPSTKKPRRNRSNNYSACLEVCRNNGPICAAPLATTPINPDTLRGFPSICHMACYNSFKKIQYEKVIDGRCGRLRTRIRPLNSSDKIKKDDLKKTQYQIIGNPQTVVEIASTK